MKLCCATNCLFVNGTPLSELDTTIILTFLWRRNKMRTTYASLWHSDFWQLLQITLLWIWFCIFKDTVTIYLNADITFMSFQDIRPLRTSCIFGISEFVATWYIYKLLKINELSKIRCILNIRINKSCLIDYLLNLIGS